MRKLLFALAVLIAMATPVAGFAASANSQVPAYFGNYCGYGASNSNLTVQQKAVITESFNKMIALRKETVYKLVQNGSITKKEGDLELIRIEAMINNNYNNYDYNNYDYNNYDYNNNGYWPSMMDPGTINSYGTNGYGCGNW